MRILIFFAFFILLASCDAERIFDRNYQFEKHYWHIDTIPEFNFSIKDTARSYDILVNIRNSSKYPFQNIYLTYYLQDTTGNTLATDLVNYQLFDAKTGKPLGDGGVGDVFDHRFPVLENFKFETIGGYRIRLQQYMRRDSLPEIISAGVRVEYNNNEE